jgi:hypothetical protein
MKKLALSKMVAFAFSMAAVAQTGTGPSRGAPGSSPSMTQPSQQQPNMPSPQQPQPDTTAGQTTPTSNADRASTEKSEKQLRGCVQSQGGQYVLESKKGKTVALTGQDVAAHAGHEVSLKGTWESGSAGTGVSTPDNTASEKTFNVTSVEMISETCGNRSKRNSGSTSTPPSGSSPEGAGATSNPPQQ